MQGDTTSLASKIAGFLWKDIKNKNGPKAPDIWKMFMYLIIQMPSFKCIDKKVKIILKCSILVVVTESF